MDDNDYVDPIEWENNKPKNPPGVKSDPVESNNVVVRQKRYWPYILAVIIAVPIVLIATYFISYNLAISNATSEMNSAMQRCGYHPIGISPRLVNVSGQTNGFKVRIAKGTGWKDEKYYCTLTEAIKDGYNRERLESEASEEINKLYP